MQQAAAAAMECVDHKVYTLGYESAIKVRRSVEDFIIRFFRSWDANDATNKLVVLCQDLVTDSRLHRMADRTFVRIDQGNFNQAFRYVCSEFFSKGVGDGHVIALLGFSIVLDKTLKKSWGYTSDMLLRSLADVLIVESIDVQQFDTSMMTTGGSMQILTSSLGMLLSSMLLFFFCCSW